MSGKLIPLTEQPNLGVIETLEAMLERAKTGELRGVVVVAHARALVSHAWGGEWSTQEAVFALEIAKHRILKEATAEDDER